MHYHHLRAAYYGFSHSIKISIDANLGESRRSGGG